MLAQLSAILVLTLIFLTSYIATISFFAPLFEEQINLTAFHKFIAALYIPHYIAVSLATKGKYLEDDILWGLFIYSFIYSLILVFVFTAPVTDIPVTDILSPAGYSIVFAVFLLWECM